MSTTIKLRRSAVPGRVPTTSQLELGELAINTADGKIYFKRYDPVANTESIIDVSADLDAAAILSLLGTVDGANSGLDADLLDGQEGSYYLDWDNFTNTATGVTANTYGSASQVPILTIDEDGRITTATTTSVAGVSNTYWTSANTTYSIETADGGKFDTIINEFSDVTVTSNAVIGETITANNVVVLDHIIAGRLSVIGNIDTPSQTDSGDLIANNATIENLTVNNDITVNGLVDGRDIAADGAKLDLLEDGLDLTLTGKVTGTASSNTGVMTLATELANTGVIAGVYGSSTAIPVFTVDEDGRLTTANTTPVAGVDNFSYGANNTITLETGDGSVFDIQTQTQVILAGEVTGTATSSTGVLNISTQLRDTGVTANTYGSSTAIPIITVDADGRITAASTTSVAGVDDFFWTSANNTLTLQTGDGSSYLANLSQMSGITVTGNIAVTGTVDGRDISAMGSKLDTIETGATGDQTASEILALLLTVDGNGSGLDADSIDGYSASEILDEAANNAAQLVGAGEVQVYGNTGIDVTGDYLFNLNSSNTHVIQIQHSDTSSVANTSLTGGNVVNGVTFDTFGHVQSTSSTDLDSRYYTETELDNGQLDNRYYTETEADSKFVDVAGDTMTGNLTVNANIIQEESAFISTSVTTASTAQATLYSFPYVGYGAAEIIISATEGGNRHVSKLLVTHDGSTAIATEYGTVYTNSELASYDVTIGAFSLDILVTPASSSSTTFKVVGTLIDV